MSNYFSSIQNIQYDIYGTEPNNYRTVTNIMKRARFKTTSIENISDYSFDQYFATKRNMGQLHILT